jgi:hypothetical protein
MFYILNVGIPAVLLAVGLSFVIEINIFYIILIALALFILYCLYLEIMEWIFLIPVRVKMRSWAKIEAKMLGIERAQMATRGPAYALLYPLYDVKYKYSYNALALGV